MPNSQTYNHYTRCTSPGNYSGLYLWSGAMVAGLAVSLALFAVDPGAGTLGLILTAIGYCRWWLYGRLVCLGQPNACVIGLVLREDTAYNQGGFLGIGKFDTDYTLYLLPAPYPLIGDENWYNNMNNPSYPQGVLMQDQATPNPQPPAPPPDPAFVLMRKTYTEQQTTEGPTPLPASPFEISVQYPYAMFVADNGVKNAATGASLQQVNTGAPVAGQYSVASGVYTFSSADQASGISVMISYTYIAGFAGETIAGDDLQYHDDGISVAKIMTPAQTQTLNFLTPPDWQAGNFYLPGNQVKDSDGGIETCITQGLSGSSAPQWPNPSLVNGKLVTGQVTADYNTSWRYDGPLPQEAIVEVEFEGAGVWNLYQGLLTAALVAGAAAIACAIPVIGWVVCAILILIALINVGSGVLNGLNDSSAEQDVSNQVGNLVPGEDILVVRGTWVWDGGHIPQGWNEFHPVLYAQRIGSVPKGDLLQGQPWQSVNNGDFTPANLPATLNNVCALTATAIDPGTQTLQQLPQNSWTIHPVVDGCAPNPVIQ
jgi:hypothetical protein